MGPDDPAGTEGLYRDRGLASMSERPRFFDDQPAWPAARSLPSPACARRSGAGASRIDGRSAVDLVKREELDAVMELAANARPGRGRGNRSMMRCSDLRHGSACCFAGDAERLGVRLAARVLRRRLGSWLTWSCNP